MSLVTVVVGQVGDNYAPIAHYCKGTVYIISYMKLEEINLTALKRDDLNIKYVYINFFNALSSFKTIKDLKNDILQKYGGIDVLINNCTYNFQANTTFPIDIQASALVNFNCFTVMKVCEVLFRLLKIGSSTVIYCALKYDYFCAIPDNNKKKTIQDNKLTSYQLKKWLNQYLEATEQKNHEVAWGNSPYAVSKAGFVALKNIHKRKLFSKGIKLFHDYGIQISVAPFCESLLLLFHKLFKEKQPSIKDQSEVSEVSTAHTMSTMKELSTIIEVCTIKEQSTINEQTIKNQLSTSNEMSTINDVNSEVSKVSAVTEVSTSEVSIHNKTKKRDLHDHIDSYNNIKQGKTDNNTAICMTVNKSQYLNVAVANSESDLTEEEAIYIQKELQNALIAMCNQKFTLEQTCIPSFDKNPMYNEGVVKFWCHNDISLAWLTETVAKLKLSSQSQLHVIDQRDVPGRVRAALFVPNFDGSLKHLQALLYHQNPWYNINLWDLCSCEKTKTEKPSGTLLIMNIPKEDAFKIVECKQRVHYAMGTINIKFITNTGFSNKPLIKRKSIVNNGNNWQLIPIALEKNDISDTSISQFPSLGEAIKEINGFLNNNIEFSWEDC